MLINELLPISSEVAIDQFKRFSKVHEENLRRIEVLREEMAKKTEHKCPFCAHVNEAKVGHRGRMQCTKCRKPFCGRCGNRHSTIITCEEWINQIGKLLDIQNKESLALIQQLGLRRCPNCTHLTEKVDGCNFMYCRCGQNFCQICSCALDSSKHWTHFNGAPYDGNCKGPSDASPLVGLKK